MKYNEEVAYNLGLTLEDIYVLEKIDDYIRDTNLSKDGNNGEFSFKQVDLFKMCKFVFKQVKKGDSQDDIKKIYKTNNAKFNKMLKGALGKVLIKGENIKKQGRSEAYFKINKEIRTILINGYPKVSDIDLNAIEQLVVKELKMNTISKGIRTQLKNMDINLLRASIEIAREENILDYPFVRGIYNNLELNNKKPQESANSQGLNEKNISLISDINSISQKTDFYTNKTKNYDYKKTKFHNFDETFTKYSDDELEDIILSSQKKKFG